MRRAHSPPGLLEGIGVAVAASLAGAALLAALAPLAGAPAAARAAVAVVALGAGLHVLARSGERTGRILTVAVWIGVSAAAWLGGMAFVPYVLLHVAMLWLARSLYLYTGVLPALADLALTALGVALAAWAARQSGSAWLALWCFFLVQACTALLPRSIRPDERPLRGAAAASQQDHFERARRSAEQALRRVAAAR